MDKTENAKANTKTAAGGYPIPIRTWHSTNHPMITNMEMTGKRTLAKILPSSGSDDALANDKELPMKTYLQFLAIKMTPTPDVALK
jgi:hypothetical protein